MQFSVIQQIAIVESAKKTMETNLHFW